MTNQQQEIIQTTSAQPTPKNAPHIPNPLKAKGITFENDFGKKPLFLAHLTSDQGIIIVLSLAGAFVGAAIAGVPLLAVILAAGVNDIKYAGANNASSKNESDNQTLAQIKHETIDVPVKVVTEEHNAIASNACEPTLSDQPTQNAGNDTSSSSAPGVDNVAQKDAHNDTVPDNDINSSAAIIPTTNVSDTIPRKPTSDPVDVALEMARIPKSTIIAASPRVGKGFVISMAISHIKRLHPDMEIWLIDPKDEPTERHYWSAIDADKRCHFDLRDFDVDVEGAIEIFSEHLTRFNRSPSYRKLLVIDEFVTLNQKCAGTFMNRLKDFIVGICSSGEVSPDKGIGRFVWAITQSPYVSDLGFKTKAALATFQRVFLLNQASINLYTLAVSASFVPAGYEERIARLMKTTGRVFYYSRSDSWYPVPNYTLPTSVSDNQIRAKLEKLISDVSDTPEMISESAETTPEPADPTETPKRPAETVKRAHDEHFSEQENVSFQRYTKLKLSFREAKELVTRLRNEMSQTKIIETLWDAKPGESKAYKDAIAEYKTLTEEER